MTRRDEVVDAAERLLEAEGPGALTMRAVAEALGIRAPSLYKHVGGKEEIEAALQERALTDIGRAIAAADPSAAGFAAAYRGWALGRPRLYELATRRPLARDRIPAAAEARPNDALVAVMGGDQDRARAFWAAAHGLVDLELAGRFPPGADVDAAWAALVAAFAR